MTTKKIARSCKNGKRIYVMVPFYLEPTGQPYSYIEASFEWMKLNSLNRVPPQRQLASKWGWSYHKTRTLCIAMQQWLDNTGNIEDSSKSHAKVMQDSSDNPVDSDTQFSKPIKNQSRINQTFSTAHEEPEVSMAYKHNRLIDIGVVVYKAEDNTSEELYAYIKKSSKAKQILAHYIQVSTECEYPHPDTLLARDLGVSARCARQCKIEDVLLIIDWVFYAVTCGRAEWRRNTGNVQLYSLLNSGAYEENLIKARTWKQKPAKKKQPNTNQPTVNHVAQQYDDKGNLI
jgi:hypothetical protein